MGKSYWMIATSPENFGITKELGFTLQGFRHRFRKRVQRMAPGDRFLYYVTGMQVFAATATMTSSFFQDHSRIWRSYNGKETYPLRVKIKANAVLTEDQFIDAREVGPRMDYVKRWAPEDWPLAFYGDLHLLPQSDFHFIEGEMDRLLRKGSVEGQRLHEESEPRVSESFGNS